MRKITEDEKILNAIHENCKRQRALNAKREKKVKRFNLIENVMIFLAATSFIAAIGFFIAIVENINF